MKACPFCAEEVQDAAVVCKHCNRDFGPSRSRKAFGIVRGFAFKVTLAIALSFVALMAFGLLQEGVRSGATSLKAAVRGTVTLADVVENLPADSFKGIRLTLPHDGTLHVEMQVQRGNPLNVLLTTPEDAQALVDNPSAQAREYPGFAATKTKTFRRDGRLAEGDYYLIIRDPSLGLLSERASDVSIRAELRP